MSDRFGQVLKFPGHRARAPKVRIAFSFSKAVGQRFGGWIETALAVDDMGMDDEGFVIEVPSNEIEETIERVQNKAAQWGLTNVKHRIIENADFDHGQRHASDLHRFDYKEFSDKGRADIPTKGVYPRADNALGAGEIDERDLSMDNEAVVSDPVHVEIVHHLLNQANMTDQEIRHGVNLSDRGKNIIAAELGISPEQAMATVNSLVQRLRDDDADASQPLAEQYRRFMAEAGQPVRPFAPRRVGNPDAIGDVCGDRLFERAKNPEADSYIDEIKDGSTYNFRWTLAGQSGFGTASFSADDLPSVRLESVTDMAGNDIEMDDSMHAAVLQKAKDFIGHE